jgi:hypothetical protein
MLDAEPQLAAARPGLTLITDKGFSGCETEADLRSSGITVLRPPTRTRPPATASRCSRPIRQPIESVNDTLKRQLDLDAHGGRTFEGVATRVAQRILAMPRPSGTTTKPAPRSSGR